MKTCLLLCALIVRVSSPLIQTAQTQPSRHIHPSSFQGHPADLLLAVVWSGSTWQSVSRFSWWASLLLYRNNCNSYFKKKASWRNKTGNCSWHNLYVITYSSRCIQKILYSNAWALYLNHGLCEDLLVNLQDGVLDVFIRDTERSQENGWMSKAQPSVKYKLRK